MTLEAGLKRGTVTNYGPRRTDKSFGGVIGEPKREAVWEFAYNNLPDAATNKLGHVIPAGSTIISAKFRVIEAFTSTSTTTDIDVGLQRSDGTEIDNDGLITVATLTQTTIGVVGALYTGAGALVGKISDATYDGELVVTPNVADLTAGRAQVIVEYLLPAATQQA